MEFGGRITCTNYLLSAVVLITVAKEVTYYATVPSHFADGDVALTLPQRANATYDKPISQNDTYSSRFGITKNGKIFVISDISDLVGNTISTLLRVDDQTKDILDMNVVLKIVDTSLSPESIGRLKYSRVKRQAIALSIKKEVQESEQQIVLDYDGAGVTSSNTNRFYLQPSLQNMPFTVDSLTGRLLVKQAMRLDYDTAPNHKYLFTVYVNNTAGSYQARVQVELSLTDVNDQPPKFNMVPFPYMATVYSGAPINTVVNYKLVVEDPDTTANIQMQIVEGGDRFSLTSTGELKTKALLTDGQTYIVKVLAQDLNGVSTQIDTASISVFVGKLPPQFFNETYLAFIPENSPLDTDLGIQIKAKSFEGNAVSFSLSPSQEFELVSGQEANTAIILTTRVLDYETDMKSYQLTITARERNSLLSSTASLRVSLLDTNDNAPRFDLSEYPVNRTFPEDVPSGTTITTVTATDADSGDNGRITYSLAKQAGEIVPFTIETSFTATNYIGTIKTLGRLDFETTPSTGYRLVVIASDSGSNVLSGSAVVRVRVSNVNDESPVFLQGPRIASVDPTRPVGSTVAFMVASDPDGDKVSYAFVVGSGYNTILPPFSIDATSGAVALREPLSGSAWNKTSSFQLNVSAADDGSCCTGSSPVHRSYEVLAVEVMGRNYPPVFVNCSDYSTIAKVPEQTSDAFVVQIKAVDPDFGVNGQLSYSLVTNANSNKFMIDPKTGEIRTTTNSIDREQTTQLSLTAKAMDSALSPLSTFCTFIVNMLDLNDNAPTIVLASDTITTAQSTPKNVAISELYAVDPDLGTNGTVTFSVEKNTNFYISSSKIMSRVDLQELMQQPRQTLDIVATDGGGLTSRRAITINIVSSANLPRFNNTAIFDSPLEILENLTDNTIIAGIQAVAFDGGSVNYFLVPQSTGEAFYMLDNATCTTKNIMCIAIYKSQKLDADTLQFYSLRIRVTPQALGSMVVAENTLQIKLRDVNDNVPEFLNKDENGYIIGTFYENHNWNGLNFLTVQANDSDLTPLFKTYAYSIEPALDGQLFRIESQTGKLFVNTNFVFDRETKAQYFIKVKAIDGAPSSRPSMNGAPNSQIADVQINIGDENDNPPYFANSRYNATVDETAVQGQLVLALRADDKDIVNDFTYSIISGNINQAFAISKAGDITVLGKLDYETNTNYLMTVQVDDGRFTASTTVAVTVNDMNDNAPVFSRNVYTITNVVEEDSSVTPANPRFLVQVSATDADKTRRTDFLFELEGANSNYFSIDSAKGQTYLVQKVDRDLPNGHACWDVNVLCSDEPGTPTNLIGYAVISVCPLDINDNSPFFLEETLTGSLAENLTPGQQVMTVKANDYDYGNNGTVNYRLLADTIESFDVKNFPPGPIPYFTIDETSGAITARAVFDRETAYMYKMSVVAYDLGTPQSPATTSTATVSIKDVNDNPPQFIQAAWFRLVSEFAQPQSIVLQLVAHDPDVDDSLAYRLDDVAAKNFSIDDSGFIRLRDKSLDYEYFSERGLPAQMNLTVTVTDGGTPLSAHSDTAYVVITIFDENDETPVFTDPEKTVQLREGDATPIGTDVATFVAYDRDYLPRNRKFEYLIDRSASSDYDRYFVIGNSTGIVRTQKLLNREVIPKHLVRILAIDNGYPARLTGTAVLLVIVEDVNDNAPSLVDPTMEIEENMPVGTIVRPDMINVTDPDDSTNGPPFNMEPYGSSLNSPNFNFVFHPDWDVPSGLSVPNGAGQLLSKKVFDRESSDGPQLTYQLTLTDNKGLSAIRNITVVIGDEDDNPPSPGHRDALVYNYKGWSGKYKVVEIGDCYAEDRDSWDKPYKTFDKVGDWPTGFTINKTTGMMTADLSVLPSGVYDYKCSVTDNYISNVNCAYECNRKGGSSNQVDSCIDGCRVPKTVTSTVRVTVKTIGEAAVWNGVSIRFRGTKESFMQPGTGGSSCYNKFTERVAELLGTDKSNVDIFSVLDSTTDPAAADVRFTAHGSPYYNLTKLMGAILNDPNFESAVGIEIVQAPINECLKELCDGGCMNRLMVTSQPTLVNANGSSLVGVTARVSGVCGCVADLGRSPTCTPASCLNGGTCIYNSASQSTSCICPNGFDGPRCQQTHHSFGGNGWAQYPTLSQCEAGGTSIEILTLTASGMILYNGPNKDPGSGPDAITDYIAIGVNEGLPVLYINFGTGFVAITVQTRVDDGRWHKIDVSKNERDITLTVDDCRNAVIPTIDTSDVTQSRRSCQVTATTPGENKYLNVETFLEMGGRAGNSPWWPLELPAALRRPFDGCVRNFMHNTQLYDLHIGSVGLHSNSQDGCPREDAICTDQSTGVSLCGANGICEAQLLPVASYQCTCAAGYRGDKCSQITTVMDFGKNSFAQWEFSNSYLRTAQALSFTTTIQLKFRSRDPDGNGLLFSATGSTLSEYIKLQMVKSKLQLRFNIGSDDIDSYPEEQLVSLPFISVTDGAWHFVKIERVGKRVSLWLDGGEGQYLAVNESVHSHQLFVVDKRTNAGADVPNQPSTGNLVLTFDLEESCVTDIRFGGKWFPASIEENAENADVQLVLNNNVDNACDSNACNSFNCPGQQLCVDLWRQASCVCPTGYDLLYTDPWCADQNECFPDNPCVHGDCNNTAGSFWCACQTDAETSRLWQGDLCEVLPQATKLVLADSGVIAIVVALVIFAAIALVIVFFMMRRQQQIKEEPLYDPYDDLRETVYNYDEEGMPEEDQDGYDISRLSKPVGQPFAPQLLERDKPLMQAPSHLDQPDVGDFINNRLSDANDEPEQLASDQLRDYGYEGQGSDAGSLSSLNTSSSGGDHNYDYLDDWGPKFSRLADMYGGGDDL